jgi:hypothetical protein
MSWTCSKKKTLERPHAIEEPHCCNFQQPIVGEAVARLALPLLNASIERQWRFGSS